MSFLEIIKTGGVSLSHKTRSEPPVAFYDRIDVKGVLFLCLNNNRDLDISNFVAGFFMFLSYYYF